MPTPRAVAISLAASLASLLSLVALERDSAACGGCFHPPTENPTVVTDHRMIFAVSQAATTLYDQMRYEGSPSSFAWVLPIAGKVTIGLSSDDLFEALDTMTRVEVVGPQAGCYVPPNCAVQTAAAPMAAGMGGGGGVTVLAHEVVGPYETVQLRATEPKALADWLVAHHYSIPPESQAIIDEYVKEQSAFLAMKLVPGASVRAMRPVRVTSPGAALTLPLRMVAAGAGPVLGVTLWVVGQGRYEPQNFPSFRIAAEDVAWDWMTDSSNYTTVRAQKTAASGGAGWQIESSLDVATSSLVELMQSPRRPGDPIPPPLPVPVVRPPGGGLEAGAGAKSPEQERAEDLATLFGAPAATPATVRVTRMRADLSHAALRQDLQVRGAADQTLVSNVVTVTREIGQPSCSVYDDRCSIVGTASRDVATAKNKTLSFPHFEGAGTPTGGGGGVKHWFSCAVSGPAPASPCAALFALGAVAGIIGRRRSRARA
jgi:MYXO-CTERM domain-containing protein